MERPDVRRNRRRPWHLTEHGGVAISICPRRIEEGFAAAMNDFSDIESELRSLRPIKPSARLLEGVARELEKSSVAAAPAEENIIRPHWFRFGGFSLGAA